MSGTSSSGDSSWAVVRRRAVSLPAVGLAAMVLTLVVIPLGLLLMVLDLLRGTTRLPLVRLLSFALCWTWLETVGVTATGVLWLTRRTGDLDAHYRLQRWWAARLMESLRITCGVTLDLDGLDALRPAPVVLLMRHASLADALLTAWLVADRAGLHPRVVLKRELLADPCLDIVGNRLPNVFVDREAEQSAPALAAITDLAAGLDDSSAAVIFPEGTRANAAKRRRALERIAARDPGRAQRLAGLEHLLPVRPSGTRALLEGAEDSGAGVVVGWHVGFDGLDTFSGILAALARPRTPIRVRLQRVDPPASLDPPTVQDWLDTLWLDVDRLVGEAHA